MISLIIYGACTPLVGLLTDRIGRRKLFVFGFFAFAVYGIPLFFILNTGFAGAFVGVVVFGMIESILNVLTVVVLPEVFPADTRVTGGAIGYNVGIALSSGTGPFVAALLVTVTGNPIAPGFYFVVVMLVVGAIVWRYLPETRHRNLYEATTAVSQDRLRDAAVPSPARASS